MVEGLIVLLLLVYDLLHFWHLFRRFLHGLGGFAYLSAFHLLLSLSSIIFFFYRAAQVLTVHAYIHISSLPVPSLPFFRPPQNEKTKAYLFYFSTHVFLLSARESLGALNLHGLHQLQRLHALAFNVESRGISITHRSSFGVDSPP